MKISIYQVDAFTDTVFKGNPAAVCPLDAWLEESIMQSIAAENNLSETAFFLKDGPDFHIRWFTPTMEIDLCGHATVATAHVLRTHLNHPDTDIVFNSKSGKLPVKIKDDLYFLNFPADKLERAKVPAELVEGLGAIPSETYKGRTDYLLIFDSEDQIRNFQPDWSLIEKVNARGICVSSKGDHCDFVSRFFAPLSGINEDPVTGSAHTSLVPFWSAKLGKEYLTAQQISHRGGTLYCRNLGERTEIAGKAVTYFEGSIFI